MRSFGAQHRQDVQNNTATIKAGSMLHAMPCHVTHRSHLNLSVECTLAMAHA